MLAVMPVKSGLRSYGGLLFIPVGLLLCCAFKQITWWKTLLIGCSISITIEALQFCFLKGFSEVDDVMHNTMGCLIGWFMVKGSRFLLRQATTG